MFYDDDQEKPLGLRPRIPASQNPMEIPAIASPQMAQMKPAVNLPGVSVAPPPTQAQTDTNELDRLKTTGSGISQIKNPVGRTLATIGNVAASLISPGLASRIPGTTEHHDQLVNNQEGIVNNDIKDAQEQAQTEKIAADAKHVNSETELAGTPKPKEETWKAVPGVTDAQGRILQEEQNSGQMRWASGISDVQPLKEPAPHAPNDFESFYADYIKDNNIHDSAHNRLMARKAYAAAGQTPQHDQRQLAVGPDGKVIELKPGMTVPQGSKTMSGDLAGPKVSADEQKRADLVENLNENLDQLEDIVNRRPELFGPLAGRMTKAQEYIGSDDQDIAALKGIEDRLGMVQQSSHGMRSAQHVAQSADSILNGFKNGAEALKRSIADARKSGATFTADTQRAQQTSPKTSDASGGKDLGAAPAGKAEGSTGTLPDGTKVIVKGGRMISQ